VAFKVQTIEINCGARSRVSQNYPVVHGRIGRQPMVYLSKGEVTEPQEVESQVRQPVMENGDINLFNSHQFIPLETQ